jgi:diketogulonate reductase-like aldo/keto reductase
MHPYFRNERLLTWCQNRGIHVTAYSPLGSPDSASMFKRQSRVLLQDPLLLDVARRIGKDAGQVSWSMHSLVLETLYHCSFEDSVESSKCQRWAHYWAKGICDFVGR